MISHPIGYNGLAVHFAANLYPLSAPAQAIRAGVFMNTAARLPLLVADGHSNIAGFDSKLDGLSHDRLSVLGEPA